MPIFDEGALFDAAGDFLLPPPAPPAPSGYLGRFQAGQMVPLACIPVDAAGFPTPPDAVPVAVITDADGNVIATDKLAMRGDAEHFGLAFFIGPLLALGTYSIAYSYSIDGAPGADAGSFDVIQGGDAGGAVISVYAYARPEAQFVVAQLSGGILVMGKNPRL